MAVRDAGRSRERTPTEASRVARGGDDGPFGLNYGGMRLRAAAVTHAVREIRCQHPANRAGSCGCGGPGG
jgi:hypothetical protein